ncbi:MULTISPECIES: MAG6450 family protein [Lactiplantibacillus]|uniref:MAG6450 family protein n=1 Tax=Lactiplantibacillus TaxID=2767842 RepID=UPI0009B5272D|nr:MULTISPECIES: hypothetical protein [Lactiplantibacillus]MBU7448442.1 hypothetical protein [Lactiplantibacillus sp. 7.2.4]MBU7480952.1 hypothetical protein [Lactiplantibacillus pentosus]MCB7465274.1 hypothetical protein [Lactiplantibacillus plantarum]MCB7468610.1 hypothetical protein [Lactiplantibacillus plantarum]MCB7472762.1 hypothetical protein [Lactiplantibacillus plantarum]
MAINPLTSQTSSTQENVQPLTDFSNRSVKFKLAISEKLDNKFMFKDLKPNECKRLWKFISSTVNCGLSITEVNELWLRKKGPNGPKNIETFNGKERKMYHLGKDRKSFRIHGYYNEDDYFVICRVDPNHAFKYK